ncbi:MAG TPA: hypothetical protein VGH73_03380 [Thermoanaerobaculia bacterium]|jgi:hypothetical protein
MFRSRSHRALVALTLGVVLTASWASAAPRRTDQPRRAAHAAMTVWDLFSWFRGSLTKAGCTIDPHGLCSPAPAPAQLDAGCGIDPHGGCTSSGS